MIQHCQHALIRTLGCLLCLVWAAAVLADDAPKPNVRLVVDYGDGVQVHFTALAWYDGMTVLDALSAAQKHPHGVKFTQRGSGSTALITQIGDLKNQGDGKNWLYFVNDKIGEVSCGAAKLEHGAAVLWRYQNYDTMQ